MKSEGGFIWACKNYDGDVQSDSVAQGEELEGRAEGERGLCREVVPQRFPSLGRGFCSPL